MNSEKHGAVMDVSLLVRISTLHLRRCMPLLLTLVIVDTSLVTILTSQPNVEKLSISQIEGLVSHGVPDSTLSVQIKKRGLVSTPTRADIDELRGRGAGPLTLEAVTSAISEPVSVREPDADSRVSPPILTPAQHQPADPNPTPAEAKFGQLFGWYVENIERKMTENWYRVAVDPSTRRGARAYVGFYIHRDGSVFDVHLDRPSGSPTLDNSCIEAALRVGSFGPLPSAYKEDSLRVSHFCEYGVHTPADGPVKIPPEVATKLLLQKIEPLYPPIARATRISGTVVIRVFITKTGAVGDLHVVSGPSMLQQSALEAVKKWRYKPYLENNEPVEVETTVDLTFSQSD